MKVSVITVCLNSEKYIEDAIKSVINQTYKDIEYIIIDGKSTDKTLEIIKKYEKNIDKLISQKDKGIFDAMNKGISLANGDIICILNSDDYYADDNVISKVVEEFKNNKLDSLYGNIVIVTPRENKIKRLWKNKNYSRNDFLKGWHPPHPAFFVKKEIYDKYGNFNLKYKIASDYELMLRFLYKYKITSKKIDYESPLVVMRAGGMSNKSILNILKSNLEVIKSWKDNKLDLPYFLVVKKLFLKLRQYQTGNEKI